MSVAASDAILISSEDTSKIESEAILSSIDESNKENFGRNPELSPNAAMLSGLENSPLVTAPTPRKSTLGRIVELFSPVKSGYPSELTRLRTSYQRCDEERQRLTYELHSQRDIFEMEKKGLIDSHRNEMQLVNQQLVDAQRSVSDVNQQLESERITVNNLIGYLDQTERFIAWCKDELDVKACLQNALESALETIDASIKGGNNQTWFNGFGEDDLIKKSILKDRMAVLITEADSEISDLKHNIFELEACIEQEQYQTAQYQQCIHAMEDDILELQVQRDQAIDELKKCSSIPDLELARAEAELIATECMVELAVAGDSLEQATNTVVSLNQQLSDMHSDVKVVTMYTQNLERQVAELIRESELSRARHYSFAQGVYDQWSAQTYASQYEYVVRNSSKLLENFKLRQKVEAEKNMALKTLLANSEASLDASNQIQLGLQREIQQAREKISLFSRYASTLQSVMGNLLEDAKDLVDYRFTNLFAYDDFKRDKTCDGIIDGMPIEKLLLLDHPSF